MTYRVEVDGVVVPESVTAGATSHREAAERVAQVVYPGKIVTVDQIIGEGIERRWFEIVINADSGRSTVAEVHKTSSGNVFRLGGRDD